jgi:CubicO group peptidase (beta-lactamase class C family)
LNSSISVEQNESIDILAERVMKERKIPGVSVGILYHDQMKYLVYGETERNGHKVTNGTYFKLGSISKSFTAYAIYLLQEQGKLKVDDDVTKYIPQFHVETNNIRKRDAAKEVKAITINHLLHHTSGIPSSTIGLISYDQSKDTFLHLMKELSHVELELFPGEKFQYATINYDILGYIIEMISGIPYHEFIEKEVLKPFGISEVVIAKNQIKDELAQGHKRLSNHSYRYTEPDVQANVPAGEFYSNMKGLIQWIEIQMNPEKISGRRLNAMEGTHQADETVKPENKYYYAGGWKVKVNSERIEHGGKNPGYSCYTIMNLNQNIAVCVLTNMNSEGAYELSNNIMNILLKRKIRKIRPNSLEKVNAVTGRVSCFLWAGLALIIEISTRLMLHTTIAQIQVSFIGGVLSLGLLSIGFYYCFMKRKMKYHPVKMCFVWCSKSVFCCAIQLMAIYFFSCFCIIEILLAL